MNEIYPDFDDFQWAAEYALTATGLDAMTNTEGPYWDNEAPCQDNLGLVGTIDLDAVDTDYFDDALTAAFPGPVSRALHFAVYATHNDSLAACRNAYISVGLTDVEVDEVIEQLSVIEPNEDWEAVLSYWRRGDVAGLQACFAFTLRGLWDAWHAVGGVLEVTSPDAFAALNFAQAARRSACATFAADVDYLYSEAWAEERRAEQAAAEADEAERARDAKFNKLFPAVRAALIATAVRAHSGLPHVPDVETARITGQLLDALEA